MHREKNQITVMFALLAKGGDVNAKATDGTTALSAAAKPGDAETPKLLKEHGAT